MAKTRARRPSRPQHAGTSRRGRVLARVRVLSQGLFLLLFFWLLLASEMPAHSGAGDSALSVPYPVSLFLEADPLVGLTTVLSTGTLYSGLLWGLLVLLATLVLGRVFCGWVCPMGALQHLVSWFASGSRRLVDLARGNRYRPQMRWKFYVLLGMLAAALFTSLQVGLLDPIALATRSLGLSIVPAADEVARRGIAALDANDVGPLQSVAAGLEWLRAAVLPSQPSRIEGAWALGLIFLGILLLGGRLSRVWCRYLCPLGALLGVSSRWSLLGLEKDEARCTHCQRCLHTCQGACEPMAGEPWRSAECHVCFNCEAACPEDALRFRFLPARDTTRDDADLQRRRAVASLAAGAAAMPLLRSSAGFAGLGGVAADEHLLRPPGALPEDEFLARCIKCGQCMKVCPTNALHPTVLQAGLEGLWTPVLVPRVGYCEPSCTLCGQVCPTGAIARLSEERKTGRDGQPPVKLGTAFYDRGRCLPWAMDTPCIVCEEWCPTSPKSIWLETVTVTGRDGRPLELQQPRVDPARCTGCGACEHACPVSDRPAVRVSRVGESRHPQNRLLLKS